MNKYREKKTVNIDLKRHFSKSSKLGFVADIKKK